MTYLMSLLGSSLFSINFTTCPFHPRERNPNFKEHFSIDMENSLRSSQIITKKIKMQYNKKSKPVKCGKGTVPVPWEEPPELLLLGLFWLPPQFIIFIILIKHLHIIHSSIPLKIFSLEVYLLSLW